MDLALLVYAITLLGTMKLAFVMAFWICVIAIIGLFIHLADAYTETSRKWAWKNIKRWFTGLVIMAILAVITPTEKTAYLMVGAYAAQKVAENERVQQLSGKVLKVLEQRLDQYIEEGTEAVGKKVQK